MIQGIKLAQPGVYTVLIESGKRGDGPWERVNVRHLRAQLGGHPLRNDNDVASGKIVGPAALSDP